MKKKYLYFIKKLNSIKWENILLAISIPVQIIHTMKTNPEMMILSILLDLIMFEGTSFAIHYGRKEILQEIKEGTFESILDLDELEEQILSIQTFLQQKKNKFEKLLSNHHTRKQLAFQKRSMNQLYNN